MKRRLLFAILLIIVLAMILKYGVNAAPLGEPFSKADAVND